MSVKYCKNLTEKFYLLNRSNLRCKRAWWPVVALGLHKIHNDFEKDLAAKHFISTNILIIYNKKISIEFAPVLIYINIKLLNSL